MRYLYIALGGALGALARWGLFLWILPRAAFPLGVLVVNLSGCLLLGFLFPYTLETQLDADLRLGIVTGFLGAYTTFSTWEAGVHALSAGGRWPLAGAYLAASLVGGVLCTVAGMSVARRLSGGPEAQSAAGDGPAGGGSPEGPPEGSP